MRVTKINPTPSQFGIGNYYEAAWTATSSNANGQYLTPTISLPAGTFLVCMMVPVIDTATYAMALRNGPNFVNDRMIHVGIGQSSKTVILKLTEPMTVHLASAQSAQCNFSYRERGGLVIVRIG